MYKGIKLGMARYANIEKKLRKRFVFLKTNKKPSCPKLDKSLPTLATPVELV